MTAETTSSPPVLEARGVSKSFPGVRALQDVSVSLYAGRLLALLGENGAGKSTLMSILAGVARPDSGELRLDGTAISFNGPHAARLRGVATIFQELSVCQNLTVAENIFLGNEPRTPAGFIDHARMSRESVTLLQRLARDVPPDRSMGDLPVGQQQLVEIARALSLRARVLIMDEPTSALSSQETASLLQIVRELKQDGVAIVYITHKLDELEHIADDVVVMRDGCVVAQGAAREYTQAQLVSLMVGRPASAVTTERRRRKHGEEVLRLNHAELPGTTPRARKRLKDVSLRVHRGEVLGIFGLMGAGRTELLETLFGAHAGTARFHLLVEGVPVVFRSPAHAIAAGLALAPEDRKLAGLYLDMTTVDNVSSACLKNISAAGVLNLRRQRALAAERAMHVGFRGILNAPTRNLSGGNQQKVVIAKWLATAPKVLLLDEPTRGIDVNARHEIYGLIEQYVTEGLAVIVASSDLPEVFALADRIMVMREGEKSAEFTREEATPERVLAAALPRESAQRSSVS